MVVRANTVGVYFESYLNFHCMFKFFKAKLKSRDYVSKLLIYNYLHKAWIDFRSNPHNGLVFKLQL